MKKGFMKSVAIIVLSLCMVYGLETGAMSADMNHGGMQHGDMQGMDHSSMQGMDHSGMAMGGEDVMLGNDLQEGVKASATLRDIHEAMAEAGMDITHHFMVSFSNAADGAPLGEGVVAVKIVDPSGQKSDAKKLMSMGGAFGADVALPQKGKYVFEVGTKLADGKKRQFSFQYTVK